MKDCVRSSRAAVPPNVPTAVCSVVEKQPPVRVGTMGNPTVSAPEIECFQAPSVGVEQFKSPFHSLHFLQLRSQETPPCKQPSDASFVHCSKLCQRQQCARAAMVANVGGGYHRGSKACTPPRPCRGNFGQDALPADRGRPRLLPVERWIDDRSSRAVSRDPCQQTSFGVHFSSMAVFCGGCQKDLTCPGMSTTFSAALFAQLSPTETSFPMHSTTGKHADASSSSFRIPGLLSRVL